MVYTYQRDAIENIHDIDAGSLCNRIEGSDLPSGQVSCNNSVCSIVFASELSIEDKAVLDGLVADEKASIISVFKDRKIAAIREKTIEEEAKGVPYNGHHFSVTPSAKSNWLAIVVASAGLTYPFSAPTGFEDIYEFQNVGDVQAFFGESMTFLKYWEESNEELIIAIDACTTKEQVDAIIDDRIYPPATTTTTTLV